jgi:hypothetical protein
LGFKCRSRKRDAAVTIDRNEAELRRAILELDLAPEQATYTEPETAATVVERVKEVFVKDGETRWWWAALRGPKEIFDYPDGDGFRHLKEHVPPGETHGWLIVENDRDGPWHVLRVEIDVIALLIGECSHFEYYVVGQQFDWLLAENHHNQLVFASAPHNQAVISCRVDGA